MVSNKNKCIQLGDMTFVEMISESQLQHRIHEIGQQLHVEYKDKSPIFVGILNGAFMFMADLVRAVDVQCDISFVKLSSYEGLSSTGKINVEMDLQIDITGRHIIVAEDIIDTGLTLSHFMDHLRSHHPTSIKIVTLLQKPDAIQHAVDAHIVGFNIANQFVVGYGLDCDGKCRYLPAIYQLQT